MINSLLSQLGFSNKETAVYLCILEHGKISPAEAADLTGIKRTTVYSIAQELLKRDVITIDLASPTQNLLALPPDDLRHLIAREEKALRERRTAVDQAIEELLKLTKNTQYSIPKVSFIKEDELEAYLYKQTPFWNRSLKTVEPIWWGYQDASFVKHYGEWIDWYWKKGVEPGISLQLLSNDTEAEREMASHGYANRKIRFWGEHASFTATTWVNGDHLIMIQTEKRPHFLVEIVDATLAHNQREVFRGIWNSFSVAA